MKSPHIYKQPIHLRASGVFSFPCSHVVQPLLRSSFGIKIKVPSAMGPSFGTVVIGESMPLGYYCI